MYSSWRIIKTNDFINWNIYNGNKLEFLRSRKRIMKKSPGKAYPRKRQRECSVFHVKT
jgi:hypothetical protein